MAKLRIALIGAGTIARRYLSNINAIPDAEVVSICRRNASAVQAMAQEFKIPHCCTDYMDILGDGSIDAVIVATPTVTHAPIVLEALKHGKHVLCEKPPAMTAEEAQACADEAAKAGKLLMYGFVRRFNKVVNFLRDYVDSGAMGDIYYAEVARMARCNKIGGWFVDKTKSGGGMLMDACIHQIDTALYLMGYPKVKSVKGYTSYINSHLPRTVKGFSAGYMPVDKTPCERTAESVACGQVHFENGACLNIKASDVLNIVDEGSYVQLCGTKAGFKETGKEVKLVSLDGSGYILESTPVLTEEKKGMADEIAHFVDCCLNGTECICKPEQGVEIMKIVSALYRSAETGREVVF